jgi:ribosomal protein S18 acetylase RimI-like enzyme
VVRPCGPRDVSDVLALWHRSRDQQAGGDDAAGLRRLIERDPEALLLAELGGRAVGSLIAAWDGWRGNMYRLTVHPEHRGQGIALELVKAGEQRLRARGARRISALVWKQDRPAVGLWQRAGYAHEEGTGRFVKTLVRVDASSSPVQRPRP